MPRTATNKAKRPFSTSLNVNFRKKNNTRLSRVYAPNPSDLSHRILLHHPPSSILDGPFSPTMNMTTHLKAQIASDADLLYNNLSAGPFKSNNTPVRPRSQFLTINTPEVVSDERGADDEVVVICEN